MQGRVIKLDRGLPLVQTQQGELRCEYNAHFSKTHKAITIGDIVEISKDASCETGIIDNIEDRKTTLVRNDPVNRGKVQVLAANFDCVAICNVASSFNKKQLLRELVIAKNCNTVTKLILTKCDLCDCPAILDDENDAVISLFDEVYLTQVSELDAMIFTLDATKNLKASSAEKLFCKSTTTVLLGKSGAGKSSLVNAVAGKEVLATGEVRSYDDKGRHTTVAREMVTMEEDTNIIDMPGVRALGLINCERGINETFKSIVELSSMCKFRNCNHKSEPGCAVRDNVDASLLEAYHELLDENEISSCTTKRR